MKKIALDHADETRRLRGMWALHVTGGLDDQTVDRLLGDQSPYVRGFAIQLSLEGASDRPETGLLAKYVERATQDESALVRLYLASAAQRLSIDDRRLLLAALAAHSEDASDHNLPLMLWYAMEPIADEDPKGAMALALQSAHPIHAEFMARRLALSKGKEGIAEIVRLLRESSSWSDGTRGLLRGLSAALEGQRRVATPEGWSVVSLKYLPLADADTAARIRGLSAKFGDSAEMATLKELVQDASAAPERRREALRTLLEVKEPTLVDLLYQQLGDSPLRGMTIRGLASYSDSRTPSKLLDVYSELSLNEKRDTIATLASRIEYAGPLLDAVERKKVKPSDLGADTIRQLRLLGSKEIANRVSEVWGVARDVSENKVAEIAKYKAMLTKSGEADPMLGRAVYAKTCGTCHELFGIGSDVGPA